MAVAALVAALVLAAGCGPPDGADHPAEISLPRQRDLILDPGHVELLEGFVDAGRLAITVNYSQENPDRPEVVVPLWRDCSIRWNVGARPGRLLTRVARLHPFFGPDTSPCVVRITSPDDPSIDMVVRVPPYPDGHSDTIGYWREGPAADVVLPLPDGAAALDIAVISRNGGPEHGAVGLFSPRVVQEPLRVPWDDWPLRLQRTQRLLGRVPPCDPVGKVTFARRRGPDGVESDVQVCPREAVANFTGNTPQPALALLAGESADFDVDVLPGSVFRSEVALDERVPPDSLAVVEVRLDGELLAAVETGHFWTPVEVPLGDRAGAGRRLQLSVRPRRFAPAWNRRPEADMRNFERIEADYRAGTLRAGIADPRVETPDSVPRRASSPSRPSVIVIHIETLRADVLPAWGGVIEGLTPNLDALASRSIVFDTAIAPSSWTLPSTVTLLTGLPPSAHGVVRKTRSAIPADVPTLAELAREQGVTTGALVANILLKASSGFDRGFDVFGELHHANAEQVGELAKAYIADHAEQQFLLWLHYMDPHSPYMAPGAFRDGDVEPALRSLDAEDAVDRIVDKLKARQPVSVGDPDVRVSRQRYLGEVRYLDHHIGRLVQVIRRLGLDDRVAIVLTADHGEEFLDHGILGHGPQLFDETVRVPLLVHLPGMTEADARRVEPVVGTDGLFATVLDLLGVGYERDAVRPGLLPARPRPFAFTETNEGVADGSTGDVLRRFVTAVRTPDALMVWRHPVEGEPPGVAEDLYDLRADPRAHTRFPEGAGPREELRRMMEASLQWSAARRAAAPQSGVDLPWLEALQRIGYVDGR